VLMAAAHKAGHLTAKLLFDHFLKARPHGRLEVSPLLEHRFAATVLQQGFLTLVNPPRISTTTRSS
jgi:hypothetical protein